MSLVHKIIDSPVGDLTLVADDQNLLAILWEEEKVGRVDLNLGERIEIHPVLDRVDNELKEYFKFKKQNFDVPISFKGTEFQNLIWRELQNIPYGETVTYGQLATRIGKPNASRAVGAAIGKNPISIIIPCHRVIGAKGKLRGFAGGLNSKELLLNLEREKKF